MGKKLIIIGAGGHGKVAVDIAVKMNKWEEIFFLDENFKDKTYQGFEIIKETYESLVYKKDEHYFVAIGDNKTRRKIQRQLITKGLSIATLIHPSAIISSNVEVGIGSAIMAGSIINSDTQIGKGCIINTSTSLDHDNLVEDYVHVSPGVRTAGNVSVGEATWLGIGSIVKNDITISNDCIIGAGAVVVSDIKEPGVYVGLPATRK